MTKRSLFEIQGFMETAQNILYMNVFNEYDIAVDRTINWLQLLAAPYEIKIANVIIESLKKGNFAYLFKSTDYQVYAKSICDKAIQSDHLDGMYDERDAQSQ